MSQMLQIKNSDVLSDVCSGLSYITDTTPTLNKYIFDAKIVQQLAKLLQSPNIRTLLPAVRTIGNIGSHDDIQGILDSGILEPISHLLSSNKQYIKKECLWAVSNLTAGTNDQVRTVVQSGIIPLVLEFMSNPKIELRTEATWLISNALTNIDITTIDYVIIPS
ncbi:importin subunit alpha-1 [Pelomyxa schiedti]|nr:importin subunit alpha-1 [Pelomyxa schiedti]